ncbi:MAG: hypothetical protein JWQ81_6809 [Amycolatopsis sp.]|uniref:BTAD domain-containing putative transcriptional regulator n=1 Tax=Amycolatopsis sp. TaxID=37632 RepID=UPI00261D1476|nr:BTAD domain-containing putative transcriptional regulator [Amycolatopsis sp.]MCU1686070.1 hypothetical protein [Amycolatopsis sp.]
MSEAALRVELLGSLRAWLGDDELALGPARQRAVFAVLAADPGRPVSRAELISAVWGDAAPASAEGSVHTYVSGLRRSMDPQRSRWSTDGRLLSDTTGYQLELAPENLDLRVFGALREHAAARFTDGDHRGVVDALDAALALWRGEAFSGVPGPFAEQRREHLDKLRIRSLEQRAVSMLALGGHTELVAELAVLVQEHPLRESLWESLMIALYRSGRHAEALEGFQHVRNILREELGIEPGPAIRLVHQRILTNDPILDAPVVEPAARSSEDVVPAKLLSVVPAQVSRALHRNSPSEPFLGREGETARLRKLVSDVLAGRGRSVWIEGPPGIGKSELLTVALADAGGRGCQVAWAVAEELGRRFPLQVIMDCLGFETADGQRHRTSPGGDPVLSAVDQLLAHVDELCARAPLMLVIDDLQWADDASVLMWHRLSAATRQLPLLLVAASRPSPDRVELAQLRRAVEMRDDEVMLLKPLATVDTEGLIGELVGANPGPGLRAMAARAFGNPLYLREVIDALMREGAVGIVDGTADIKGDSFYVAPGSLVAAVGNRLDFLSEPTREVLRRAALLGMEFGVAEVSATMGKAPSELLDAFEEGVASSVIIEAGAQLAFRHPMLRQSLYEGIPADVRVAWHRRAAEALSATGAPVERVAEQLVAVPAAGDAWVVDWLATHHDRLAERAPLIAVDLVGQSLDTFPPGDAHRQDLLLALVRVLHRLDREPEQQAREALETATDPASSAELRHILAAILYRRGRTEAAVAVLDDNNGPEIPELWRERTRSLLANFRRGDLSDLDATVAGARKALESTLASNDRYPAAHALQTLWLVDTIRRDHRTALGYINRALDVVSRGDGLAGMRFDLLDNRMFSLQNLDRLDDAEAALRSAREVAAENSLPHGLQVSAAVQQYWRGHWDEALVELDTVTEDGPAITFHGLREPGAAALLLHGVAALISGRRGRSAEAASHLDAADGHLPVSDAERESCDFLLVARSLSAEQRGEPALAIELLAPILDTTYAQLMLRHQWLPDLTRLAVDTGHLDCARAALAVCDEEAEKEVVPARAAAAAARCRALIDGDPEPMLAVAAHYRTVGRRLEMASAQEDAAVLLARHGRLAEARANFDAAVKEFATVGALWDIRRAESRLREFGVVGTGASAERLAESGWSSLSDVETKIATLVALGRSNPGIARELALPRRTVQAHVARVLAKLGANSRIGIVAEVTENLGRIAPAG